MSAIAGRASASGSVDSKLGRCPVKHPASTRRQPMPHQRPIHVCAIPDRNGSPKSRRGRVGDVVGSGGRPWRRQATALPCSNVIRLDAATVLLQWATGGMLFCWFTTRRRIIGLGLRLAAARRLPLLRRRCARRRAALRRRFRSARHPSLGVALACVVRAGGVGAPQGRRCERAAGGVRPTVRAGRGDDGDRTHGRRTGDSVRRSTQRARRVPARARPRAGGRSARSDCSRPPSTPAATRPWRSCARSSGRRSSAPSPTRCCSATGTSCSRVCRAGCSTRWSPRCRCCGRWS